MKFFIPCPEYHFTASRMVLSISNPKIEGVANLKNHPLYLGPAFVNFVKRVSLSGVRNKLGS